jgi:predicted O-methyltransferase YrrM
MFGLRNPFSRPVESWHVHFIDLLAKTLNPQVYLEIGIYEGETFNRVEAPQKIAVDIRQESLDYVGISEEVIKIHGDSKALNVFLSDSETKVDLAFIDADHHSESLIQDFMNIKSFITTRGLVLFHDTYPGSLEYSSPKFCGDGFLAIPILRAQLPDWNFVTLPVHPGLTLASRTDVLPEWYKTAN